MAPISSLHCKKDMSKKVQIERVKELYDCADDGWFIPLQALCYDRSAAHPEYPRTKSVNRENPD